MSVKDMTYSFSRLKSYSTCPFKWHKTYVEKLKEPSRTYFSVGTICHEVAELSANYCVRKTFLNKAEVFYEKSPEFRELNEEDLPKEEFVKYVYLNRVILKNSVFKNYGNLSFSIDKNVSTEDYTMISMPPTDVYWKMFDDAVAHEGITDPSIIAEARSISRSFMWWYDFSIMPFEVMLSEKKLAFKKNWDKTGFFSDDAYFRGVIDNTIYTGDKELIITDYKTSRAMLTEYELREEMQLKSYVKMMIETIGRANVDTVTVRIVYMRFKKIVSYTYEDIDYECDFANTWISGLINKIESDDKFECNRNDYCDTCFIKDDDLCPMFNKVKSLEGSISDIKSVEDCAEQWKSSESIKHLYGIQQRACKSFIASTDSVVEIDGGILDRVKEEAYKVLPEKVVTTALKKGLDLKTILKYMTMSPTQLDKLTTKEGIKFSKKEIRNSTELKMSYKYKVVKREE